jgi:5'-3' exonuclease
MIKAQKRFLEIDQLTLEEAEFYADILAHQQRDIMFHIGDLFRAAKSKWPDTHNQIWPEWVSPGMLLRAGGVCGAYPDMADRQHEATYSQYMHVAGKPDRHERLAEMVDKGQTTDESRKAAQEPIDAKRWLLAIDTNYFLHRFWFSGAGVESAVSVASWIQRTVDRLKKDKGLTDVACCFDSKVNYRKELTAEWEDKYKDRPPKDPELGQQLTLVHELLKGHGFACVQIEGMEADDIMASYARQFGGRVTLMSQDKDQRQCLSDKCNILLDVEWKEDETSGEKIADYKWLTAKSHTEATGIPPEKWCDYQAIMGDNVDGIRGAAGIGQKGAADLIQTFGSAESAIEAAKADDERIKPAKRKALIEFVGKLEVTRNLVTLRDDLEVPANTRI